MSRLIELLDSKNITLVLYTPPMHLEYRKLFDEKYDLNRMMSSFLTEYAANKKVIYLNFDSLFDSEKEGHKLFFDSIHLNLPGARLFSNELGKGLEEQVKQNYK